MTPLTSGEFMAIFKDRTAAGKKLGQKLALQDWDNPVVFGLPRGGVVVAHEVAKILSVPLNLVVARKIGAPGHPEYGIGALSEDEIPMFNPEAAAHYDVHGPKVLQTVLDEKIELRRRIQQYRQGEKLRDLTGRTILLVDDGLATGVTAAAAARFLRSLNPAKIILVVPVGPTFVGEFVDEQFDEIFCLNRPENFQGVGLWYEDFSQTEDSEVMSLLSNHREMDNRRLREEHGRAGP